jgi:hypothetical protein
MRKCPVKKKEIISERSDRSIVHPPVEAKNPSMVKNDGERGGNIAN